MGNHSSPSIWSHIVLTAFAPIIWGSTYIVTSALLPPDRPFTAALIRVLPAGLLLVLFTKYIPNKQQWSRLLIISALNIGLFQAFLFIAAYRLPGGLAAVLGAIQPLFVMLLARLINRHRTNRLALGASVFGVLGMAILLLSPNTTWNFVGVLAALTGAICMATGIFFTNQWKLSIPVLALTGWQLLLGGMMLLPVVWLADAPLPALSLTQTLAYAYLCFAGALLAYILWFRGMIRLSPVAMSSLGLLSPLTAVVLGWVFLGQAMTGTSLLGLVMVLASVLVVQWAMAQSNNREIL